MIDYFLISISIINTIVIIILCIYIIIFNKKNKLKNIIQEIKKDIDSIILELQDVSSKNIHLMNAKIEKISFLIEKASIVEKKLENKSEKEEEYFSDKKVLKKDLKENSSLYYSDNLITKGRRIAFDTNVVKIQEKKISLDREKEEKSNVYQVVLDMNKKGFSQEIIARKLNLEIGEVELIISLKRS